MKCTSKLVNLIPTLDSMKQRFKICLADISMSMMTNTCQHSHGDACTIALLYGSDGFLSERVRDSYHC